MAIARLTLRRRWWVPLYLAGMRVLIWCWAPFLAEDEIDAWAEREMAWLLKRGYRVVVE